MMQEVYMSVSRKCARWFLGLILALVGSALPTSGQTPPNGVNTWSRIGSGVAVYSLAIDPKNPNTIYAGTNGGVSKSTDGGVTWNNTPSLGGDGTTAIVIDSVNPNIVYAAITFTNFCHHSFRRLFKSTDGGASWSNSVSPRINGCDKINSLVMDPRDPNTLYVANFDDFGDTAAPLVKSINGGDSWSAPSFNPPFTALAINPLDTKTLYAGTFDFVYFGYQGDDDRNGVLKSADGGVNWGTTGLIKTGVDALAIDPINPNTLYAATRGFYSEPKGIRGLFKSTDGGVSWFAFNNGLTHLIGTY